MSTKLSRFSEGIMEAVWLAAVIVVPVFFNIYSSRIFEPDKITLLRTLALVALGAWIVKIIEEGKSRWDNIQRGDSLIKTLLQIPFLAPVTALVIVYLISTIFSITPRVSLLGSYQRLQGTYTTISYIVVFAVMVGNLRKRVQVERLITTIILASLPISLYGILQRYGIDPVPWGGNVSRRIASNLGNSIFVAAYLIMAVPLTFGRIIQSFRAILKDETRLWSQIVRATFYVFIAAMELLAIYLSGSRGPLLGLLAGLFFLFVLLSLYWKKRWLIFTTIGVAGALGIFLVVLSIPNGPLESLRSSSYIGRFGRVFDTEERTSQVRILIWHGAYKLVSPHPPLNYPDSSKDKLNFLRPLIGYGPEGMYVAYNQFYPPELGRVEKRNASPDRSHNETWDSLVITGILGLGVYLWVYGTVFYYGLKWLGLINSRRQRMLFLALLTCGGLAGVIGISVWQGVEFIGVGLPLGMILGALAYLTIFALFASLSFKKRQDNPDAMVLMVLLAAIIANFVEINFGIAIAATRTYFWVYSALILIVGYILPKLSVMPNGEDNLESGQDIILNGRKQAQKVITAKRQKKGRERSSVLGRQSAWIRRALIGGVIVGLIMVTLGYDFISNSTRLTSSWTILVNSMTRLPNKDNAVSFGVLAMVVTTWLSSVLLVTAENEKIEGSSNWWKAFCITLGLSGSLAFFFWLIHAGNLVRLTQFSPANQNDLLIQAGNLGGLFTNYYIYLFLIIIGWAFILPGEWPTRSRGTASIGVVVVPAVLIVVLLLTIYTNLHVIYADMAFKMAEPFTKNNQWPVATLLYQHALKLAPNEDHYYLFLGRSYLEQAKTVESAEDQGKLILQAESDLKVAQGINPLNTDHTANLGRLYSWWAGRATEGDARQERGTTASSYYDTATKLSPNNPGLWGEWAILLLDILKQRDLALEKLNHAIGLDEQYNFTQGLMGDYYLRVARSETGIQAKTAALEQAIIKYREAIRVSTGRDAGSKITYVIALGNAYIELAGLNTQNIDKSTIQLAIDAYLQAINLKPKQSDLYKIEETIAKLFAQVGDKANALVHVNASLEAAPEGQKERLQTLVDQINAMP